MIYVSRRLIITCLLLVSACVVAGIWGLRSGAITLETSQVFAALMGDAPRSMTMVVTEWRLPRVLMALLIGAALGVSGAIFQSLMRNPLGSPDVMGFNTGAWSGVLVAMMPVTARVAISCRKRREPFNLSSELVPFSISSRIISVRGDRRQLSMSCFRRSSSALK